VRITIGVSVLLILTVAIHHSLTGEAFNDNLCLLSLHCLSSNLCPKSLFQLKRHLHTVTNPISYHYFCAGYLEKLNPNETKETVCPNIVFLLGNSSNSSTSGTIHIWTLKWLNLSFCSNNLVFKLHSTQPNDNVILLPF